ncbi:LysR family transcriptional regulator [Janthinobacterium agaricidamnosum]|uniref:Bacterial regulatory helix-turn-helix, lysR family protein n=1 Tax=Janthinobacterium agaricidamnosum NBRC 102515 = DSM 9628 TaxID=1349767 RepID=W0UYI0_9BURK|nr:LysR substrate-binding domain-containing protein [Janthinobacterium agaricidamnosum]CDG80701.1 bacterial regulatory helix-turn-helix, lysR family protein [Janthinobacterium agaricidamnosum NBRC 102515 = DSM 9628]
MRLRHIEVFHAIMQVGTISGAAQVLHISQPAVTKVLQHCELQLGMPLFERVRGKLYPKPEAHRLFVETEKLHRDLQGIRRLAAGLKGQAVETVRLVSTPTIAISVLPKAMTDWRRDFPLMRCQLATHHTSEIVNTLRLGEADLALSLQDPRHPGIVAEAIAQGVMTAIAPAGTWRAADCGTPLFAQGLNGELIGHADHDPLGELVIAACEAQDIQPVFNTVVQTYQIARSLVEAGAGMAVVDPFTAASGSSERLQRRPWAPAIPVQLFLLTASHAPLSHGARQLANSIGMAARACLERGKP